MNMQTFLRKNRENIDYHIRQQTGQTRINDRERELWVLNDEGMYLFARYEGVEI